MSKWTLKDDQRFVTPVTVTVEVDDAIFTEEMAGEINSFWSDADSRLAWADEDVRKAALMMVATMLLGLALEHDGNARLMQRDFDGAEGFPLSMVKVVACEGLPPLEYHELTIEAVP